MYLEKKTTTIKVEVYKIIKYIIVFYFWCCCESEWEKNTKSYFDCKCIISFIIINIFNISSINYYKLCKRKKKNRIKETIIFVYIYNIICMDTW